MTSKAVAEDHDDGEDSGCQRRRIPWSRDLAELAEIQSHLRLPSLSITAIDFAVLRLNVQLLR
jgi:hypothetical protein